MTGRIRQMDTTKDNGDTRVNESAQSDKIKTDVDETTATTIGCCCCVTIIVNMFLGIFNN
jgi:hypothetical protein